MNDFVNTTSNLKKGDILVFDSGILLSGSASNGFLQIESFVAKSNTPRVKQIGSICYDEYNEFNVRGMKVRPNINETLTGTVALNIDRNGNYKYLGRFLNRYDGTKEYQNIHYYN